MRRSYWLAAAALTGCLAAEGIRGAVGSAWAQTVPAGPGEGGGLPILATGGAQSGQNDLCWVLTKVRPAKGKERMVLALYRAGKNGEDIALQDVRWVDPDLRMLDWKQDGKAPSVKDVLKDLPKEERDELLPPPPPPTTPTGPGAGGGAGGGAGTRPGREAEPPAGPK